MTITCTQPGDLDRALAAARNPGDQIIARNGTFTTKGNWGFPNFLSLAAGVKLDATGSTIRFDPNPTLTTGGIQRLALDLNILWAGGDTDGSIMESVTGKGVAPNAYVSGIYVGGTVEPQPGTDGSKVTLCSVDLGADNQFAYSCSYKTTFSSSQGKGGRYGLYTDTGPMIAFAIGCTFSGSYAAVSSVSGTVATRSVVLQSCQLSGERAVEWWDKSLTGAAMAGGIAILDSTVDAKFTAAVVGQSGNIVIARNKLVQPPQVSVPDGSRRPLLLA